MSKIKTGSQNLCLQNHFTVNKIRFAICEVRGENSFPETLKALAIR